MNKVARLAILACALATSVAAHAQLPSAAPPPAPVPAAAPVPGVDPATAQAVRELLDAMDYKRTMNGVFQVMSKNLPNLIRQMSSNAINGNPKLSEAQKKEAQARVEKLIPEASAAIQSVLNDPNMIDEMIAETVPLYARHFTLDEVQQLRAFYATPLGRKMIATMPEISGEAMQISQRVLMPRIVKTMEKYIPEPAPAKPAASAPALH